MWRKTFWMGHPMTVSKSFRYIPNIKTYPALQRVQYSFFLEVMNEPKKTSHENTYIATRDEMYSPTHTLWRGDFISVYCFSSRFMFESQDGQLRHIISLSFSFVKAKIFQPIRLFSLSRNSAHNYTKIATELKFTLHYSDHWYQQNGFDPKIHMTISYLTKVMNLIATHPKIFLVEFPQSTPTN